MLSISVVNDKDRIVEYCKSNKLVYSPAYYLYTADDKGKELAYGVFRIESNQVQIEFYKTTQEDDYHLFDGILRAGFNYANENGIPMGVIPESFRSINHSFFDSLNFPSQSVFNIDNFFDKYKNCTRI